MEHTMKLYESSFHDLKQGKKVREYRLNDEKRKLIRIGDTIRFLKLPELEEEYIVDVKEIETFDNWLDCYSKYFEEDFKNKYQTVEEVVEDTYKGGYYTKEESEKNGCIILHLKKHRILHHNATACYLKKDNQVLMIKFNKKWNTVYAPPGGKFESGESPLDCMMREYYEETGLTLINPKLQGLSYWKDDVEGIIYIFTAEDYKGEITESAEGKLEWIEINNLENLEQFDQNKKFTPYLFQKEVFEGKFLLDDKCQVIEYKIRKI